MAAMEQLEIHSRSYLVRWVDVVAEHTISWSIQPHKKSINFGIFKHPGSGMESAPRSPSTASEAPEAVAAQNPSSITVDKLKSLGYKLVLWHGTCEANHVTTGTYDVLKGEGGMYALVFDNMFSKSFSKTATFVHLTYPTGSAPLSSQQTRHPPMDGVPNDRLRQRKSRSNFRAERRRSSESVPVPSDKPSLQQLPHNNDENGSPSNLLTGVLQKRRRKKGQGYARRFFCLDFSSSSLSYYHDRSTHSIRGVIPLTLAAIGANAETREISVDSGAEVWHLKAISEKDFESWRNALQLASMNQQEMLSPVGPKVATMRRSHSGLQFSLEDEKDWVRAEALVRRLTQSRDAAGRLAQETDPKFLFGSTPGLLNPGDVHRNDSGSEASPSEHAATDDYFASTEKRSFWRRKATGVRTPTSGRKSVSSQAPPAVLKAPAEPDDNLNKPSTSSGLNKSGPPHDSLQAQCSALVRDLDAIVSEFNSLIAESRRRRTPMPQAVTAVSARDASPRRSMESSLDQEFFDAEDGGVSQLLTIQPETDDEESGPGQTCTSALQEEESSSEIEGEDISDKVGTADGADTIGFPSKPKHLEMASFAAIVRRSKIQAPTVMPPSLIGFLRKNVGKDLSTISMPVSANEPLSLLQKVAEQMEYSDLLDEASKGSLSNVERLLYVTAFAVSALSSLRVKERAIRKPFNPMLGETFELIREDKGYRFIAEKVTHRPVRMACQADSEKWSLNQSPMPTQKFWGKSAELITEGRVRLSLHTTGERFSWDTAHCFLRNIIAGEKYVEPVGTMTVTNESNGEHAIITFKAKGMFSGRSEEVAIQCLDSFGDELPLAMAGKWTHTLSVVENDAPRSTPSWTVGELVPDAAKCYGFTAFAATLNEISSRDKLKMAHTDSRLRPDQRAAEEGDIDKAEELKAKLEEAQRTRRKAMDDEGVQWEPMWFSKLEGGEGEEIWKAKSGKDSYWERRAKGDWKGVAPILEF